MNRTAEQMKAESTRLQNPNRLEPTLRLTQGKFSTSLAVGF